MSTTMTCLASLMTVAVLAVPAFGAEKVGGTFRFAKAKVTFTHGCAFRVAVETRPGERTTTVFLADRPVDCAAAGAGFHPEAALQAQIKGKGSFVQVTFKADEHPYKGEFSTPSVSDGYPFGFSGQGSQTIAVDTPTRIEGRVFTTRPESFFKDTYEFDFTFALDVSGAAVTGTQLPAGGGAPGSALQAFVAAAARDDEAALGKVMTTDDFATYRMTRAVMKELTPRKVTVLGGLQKGDMAALDVTGTSHGDMTLAGRVLLVRDAGGWKVSDRLLRVTY